MKFAIFIEDYHLFYTRYLDGHPDLNAMSYSEKLAGLLKLKYYQADSLAQALVKLGHEAEVIIPECNPLQLSWAKEHAVSKYIKWLLQRPWRSFQARVLKNYYAFNSIREEVLLEQIRQAKPDVVIVYSNIWMGKDCIRAIKQLGKKIVLMWSCPVIGRWKGFAFNEFDLVVSASVPLVKHFKAKGLNAHYLQQSFDDSILGQVKSNTAPSGDVVFIGNFTLGHNYRFLVIEYLLQNGISIDVYGEGGENVPENSMLKKVIAPPVQGIEMYNVYKKYKIALHIHGEGIKDDGIDWSSFAGAKRNFEITGIGTALLTSYQDNLSELFKEGEVIAFRTKEECLDKIRYYLARPEETAEIASASQQRTLSSHTFNNRAGRLVELINI